MRRNGAEQRIVPVTIAATGYVAVRWSTDGWANIAPPPPSRAATGIRANSATRNPTSTASACGRRGCVSAKPYRVEYAVVAQVDGRLWNNRHGATTPPSATTSRCS